MTVVREDLDVDEEMEALFEQLKQDLYRLGRDAALEGRPKIETMGPFYSQGYDETKQLTMDIVG